MFTDLDRFLDRLHHGQEIGKATSQDCSPSISFNFVHYYLISESDVSDMEATVRNLQRRIDELEATVESHYQRSY
jgi:hypothetical protein